MDIRLTNLLDNAEIAIHEFSLDTRTELNVFKRKINSYLMCYQKEGTAKLRIHGKQFTVTPGHVICIPPNVEHDYYKESFDRTVFLWWHFHYQIGNCIDLLKFIQLPILFKIDNPDEFEKVFYSFFQTTSNNIPGSSILKKAKALELLFLIIQSGAKNKENELFNSNKNFFPILLQIIEHPEKPVSLKQMAHEIHLHPTYITNRFKQLFGKTPLQIHNQAKTERAKRLLLSDQMQITEVSERLGFPEVQHFTRFFKLHVGVAPSVYRKLAINENQGGYI